MSDAAIRKALETRLAAIATPLSTAYENDSFEPVPGTPYQRVHLLPAEPETPEMTGTFKRFSGFMQVSLMYPQGTGPGDATVRAKAIQDWFSKNLSLVADGITVTMEKAPYVMAGFADGDRWVVPVRVYYFANIS
jgi:hypothetical protein